MKKMQHFGYKIYLRPHENLQTWVPQSRKKKVAHYGGGSPSRVQEDQQDQEEAEVSSV